MQHGADIVASPISSPHEEDVYAKVTRRLIPFLFVCYLAAYLDRVNVGFAKLQMAGELGFDEAVYGLGAGIFFVGYVLFEVPSNLIMLRVGARVWIARIMLTWGVLSAAMIYVRSPAIFYGLRFLLGVAEAGFIPGVLLYLTYWYPAARRGKITALFLAAIPCASIIGGPVSGLILRELSGSHGISGWQWLFIVEAVPSLVLGIVTLLYLDDRVADVTWLSADEKTLVAAALTREAEDKAGSSHLHQALGNPRVWLLGMIYFSIACGIYIVSFWLPSLIRRTGVSDPLSIGLLSALPYAAAIVAMIAVNIHADRSRERRWHTILPAVACGIGLALTAGTGFHTAWAIVGLTIAAAGASAAQASFWCIPSAFLGGEAAAAGIALVNSLGNVAGFVSTFVVGWATKLTHGSGSALYFFAAIVIVGSTALLLVPSRLIDK